MKPLHHHPAAAALSGFLALAAALGIGRFVYTPILPYMSAGLEIGKLEAGLVASANFLGYLLGALAAARTTLPGSRRRWLLGALGLNAGASAAMALTASMSAFLVLRFAGGAASALVMVFASALVLDRLSALSRPGWAAVLYAGVGGGIVVSALMVPSVASGGDDWRGPWLASGAVAAAAMIPVWWLAPRGEEPSSAGGSGPGERTGGRAGGAGHPLRRLVLAYGLFGFGYVITATFISDMARMNPVLRPAEHLVWLLVGLTAAPSVALWTWAARRWGNGRSFAAACLLEAVGVALSVAGGGVGILLLAAVLLGGTFMGLTALGLVSARQSSAGDPRRALALMTASFGAGQMIGPSVAGVLHDLLGSYLLPSLLAAAALVFAAALTLRLPPPPVGSMRNRETGSTSRGMCRARSDEEAGPCS